MNRDGGNNNLHERARLLIAVSGPEQFPSEDEELRSAERRWLAAHLESCPSCREFAENTGETIRRLRTLSIMADGDLVSTTRIRVRQRALAWQRRQERLRVIWVCCAAVTLCTAINTALLWRGMEWLSQQMRLSAPLLELGAVTLGVLPAIVAGMLLLARGTYLADHNGSFQG